MTVLVVSWAMSISWLPSSVHWVAAIVTLLESLHVDPVVFWGVSALSSRFLVARATSIWEQLFGRSVSEPVPSSFQQWATVRGVQGFAASYILTGQSTNAAVDARRNLWVTQNLLKDPNSDRVKGIINP